MMPRLLPGKGVRFRTIGPADLDLLHEWHRRDHVLAWWPDPPSVEELRASCLDGTDSTEFMSCLALHDNDVPFGYIQSYRAIAGHAEGWWLEEQDPGVLGIDQFLADGERLSRGLGMTMVCAFVELLLADPHVSRIQADPDPANLRAIRCYEKSGFRAAREVVTPDGRALLMYRDR